MSAAGKPDATDGRAAGEAHEAREVTADELDADGAGVGTLAGRRVHVAGLLPGERAAVALTHASPHRPEAWARIVARVGPTSPDRVAPACPAFGHCGGCPWQHLAYPAQLRWKHRRVADALAGLCAPLPVVPSPAVLGYRHKGKYVAGRTAGRVALGAWAPRTHTFVDTAGCRAVTPAIDATRAAIVEACADARVAPADEARRTGDLRYAVIRQAGHAPGGAAVLVALVVRSAAPADRVLAAARAIAAAPGVAGVVRIDNDRTDGAILAGAPVPLAGADTLDDTLAGVPVSIGATEFAQVQPAQADAIYAHVASLLELRAGDRAADLYAGLGGISFALAARGAAVVAIERDTAAVAALSAAAARAALSGTVDARAGDASTLASFADPIAAVVVNPPRKGLSPATVDAVNRSAASRLAYVSCGPESLARDLAALAAAGWRIDHAQPFDLMPGTAQIEAVVRATR